MFALANPDPEVDVDAARQVRRVVATGRSDYPNQINNVLAFPGVFRGLLDARASQITTAMLLSAAAALARCVSDEQLNPSYIIPSVFDPRWRRRWRRRWPRRPVRSDRPARRPGHGVVRLIVRGRHLDPVAAAVLGQVAGPVGAAQRSSAPPARCGMVATPKLAVSASIDDVNGPRLSIGTNRILLSNVHETPAVTGGHPVSAPIAPDDAAGPPGGRD